MNNALKVIQIQMSDADSVEKHLNSKVKQLEAELKIKNEAKQKNQLVLDLR